MNLIFLDVETKKSFSQIDGRDPGKLEVSFVGIYQRGEEKNEFGSFFEPDLPNLWPILEKADKIIGYNIDNFDFPALDPYYPGSLSGLPTLDLLKVVQESLGRRLRLDNLAEATLGHGKIGSGLDAIVYWREGKLEELEKYCLMDVEVTRDIYDFGFKNGFLKYIEPPDQVRQFPLVWPEEEKKEGVSLTLGI
ncbi:ribonuclease H-like domain-containing protein [Patescibacteria group bacterium]